MNSSLSLIIGFLSYATLSISNASCPVESRLTHLTETHKKLTIHQKMTLLGEFFTAARKLKGLSRFSVIKKNGYGIHNNSYFALTDLIKIEMGRALPASHYNMVISLPGLCKALDLDQEKVEIIVESARKDLEHFASWWVVIIPTTYGEIITSVAQILEKKALSSQELNKYGNPEYFQKIDKKNSIQPFSLKDLIALHNRSNLGFFKKQKLSYEIIAQKIMDTLRSQGWDKGLSPPGMFSYLTHTPEWQFKNNDHETPFSYSLDVIGAIRLGQALDINVFSPPDVSDSKPSEETRAVIESILL